MGKALTWLHRLEDSLLASMLGAMILLACAQIFLRNFADWNFAWGDPLVRVMVLWVGLLGALAASRGNQHITVDVLSSFISGRLKAAARSLSHMFTTGICTVLAYVSYQFVLTERDLGSEAFRIGEIEVYVWVLATVAPYAFGLMAVRYALLFLSNLQQLLTGRIAQDEQAYRVPYEDVEQRGKEAETE